MEKGFTMLNQEVKYMGLVQQAKEETNLVKYSSTGLTRAKDSDRIIDLVRHAQPFKEAQKKAKIPIKLTPCLASTLNDLNEEEAALLLRRYKYNKSVPHAPLTEIYDEQTRHVPEQTIQDEFFGKYYIVPREQKVADSRAYRPEFKDLFGVHSDVMIQVGPVESKILEDSKIDKHEKESVGEVPKSSMKRGKSLEEELIITDQVRFLRTGPSCPELLERVRHIVDIETEPSLESAHLDFALVMNMLEGNWGVDEDQTIAQITFKYIHDEAFRKRLAKECFNLLDECDCPLHLKINSKQKTLNESNLYEIETENDRIEVVDRLKAMLSDRYEDKANMDLERLVNVPPDSDDDEYYQEGVKKVESDEESDPEDPSKCPDKFHSEEALLQRFGFPGRPEKIKINRIKMKNLVKPSQRKNIQEVVETLYHDKVHEFRVREYKEIKWRPEKVFAYKRPSWSKNNPTPKNVPTE